MAQGDIYVFIGNYAATWKLPVIGDASENVLMIKNRGNATLTLLSASGSQIYETSAEAQAIIAAGGSAQLINDGTYWVVI